MISDFLKTATPKADLAAALRVLREFKAGESREEWMRTPFACWVKLEQLEEFLAHLVEGAPLKDDTVAHLQRRAEAEATVSGV